jgi:hypothetical protein
MPSQSAGAPAGPAPRTEVDPPFLNDLGMVEEHAWSLLERGAKDRRSPYHAPSIATVSDQGPQVRTFTLRALDRERSMLHFNADARSGLVGQLEADPRAAVHAYGAAEKTQLRLRTRATLHRGDPLAAAAWHATTPSAKRCYLVPPPGSLSGLPTSGLPMQLEHRCPIEAESDVGFIHFCVVELKIEAIEWLHVHAIHKRRARFDLHDGCWQGTWLTP